MLHAVFSGLMAYSTHPEWREILVENLDWKDMPKLSFSKNNSVSLVIRYVPYTV